MGKGSRAPSGYQPTWQAGADQNFQGLQGQMTGLAGNLMSQAPGQYQGILNNTYSNPYYTQAQQGANDASSWASGAVAPGQFNAAANEYNAGSLAQQLGSDAWGRAMGDYGQTENYLSGIMSTYGQSPSYVPRADKDAQQLYDAIPQATQGYQYAAPAYQDALARAQQTYGLGMGVATATLPGQLAAADQVLQTGYDPQQQLYDRTYQQLMEQQNAINAQQGVSGSPFAAGVNGQAAQNFNIDWQNNQLQRQISALNAYSGATDNALGTFGNLVNGAAGNYANLLGTGSNVFNNMVNGATSNLNTLDTSADNMIQQAKQMQFQDWQQSMNDAVNRYATMAGVAGNQLSAAGQDWTGYNNAALNNYANASDMGAAGLNTMTTAAMYPNEVYMNQQNQILQALNAMVGGTSSAMQPGMGLTANDLNYMQTGQNATRLAQNAAQMNQQSQAGLLSGLGQLAGFAMAPFTGGMSLLPSAAGGFGHNGRDGGALVRRPSYAL